MAPGCRRVSRNRRTIPRMAPDASASAVGCGRALCLGSVASWGGGPKHPCDRWSRTTRAPDRRPGRPRRMTWIPSTGTTGGPDSQFCERCGGVTGEAASLRRVGLRSCSSCGVHACGRCWARTAGSCPGCGVAPIAAVGVASARSGRARWSRRRADPTPAIGAAALAGVAGPGSRPRRADRSVASAVGVTIIAIAAVAFSAAGPLRPTGGVESVVGTPGIAGVRSGEPAESSSPGVIAPGDGATPSPRAQGPVAASTERPGTRAPTTDPTSTTPTPRPTPRPTPPRPTPSPPACVAVAPQLIGQRRSDAVRLWKAAGFTSAVTALDGHGNYEIATQNRTAGKTYACDAPVTVGP